MGRADPELFGVGVGSAIASVRRPLTVVRVGGRLAVGPEGGGADVVGVLPPLLPEHLGDPGFLRAHGVRVPYVTGSMANGIASVALVAAAARAGALGFFGSAGLDLDRVDAALVALADRLPDAPWGANLIADPNAVGADDRVADRFVARGVRYVEVSAYTRPTPAVVVAAARGLRVSPEGRLVRPRAIFAKVSHPDTARAFASAPPAELVNALVASGRLTEEEAGLALRAPIATDLTVEADSGGHTDNRPLVALFPTVRAVCDQVEARNGWVGPRVGAAGGLGDPAAVAAAFALGAAYVLTGSVNQASVESGLSAAARALLAEATVADVAMAAAADMFEQGVKVQVLRRGTMFAARANRLYELYRRHDRLEALSASEREELEARLLGAPVADVWQQTAAFFAGRDPEQLARADIDPKHRMALVFRWYLGRSSGWAVGGDPARRTDWQIWCGPAMGAFNTWSAGTFLADPERRTVGEIAANLLEGAAVLTRAHQLRSFGIALPRGADRYAPRPLTEGR